MLKLLLKAEQDQVIVEEMARKDPGETTEALGKADLLFHSCFLTGFLKSCGITPMRPAAKAMFDRV